MRPAIYLITAILTTCVYSFATTLLVVAGIEKTGGDPGSPGIMLFVLFFLCAIASLVIAVIMEIGTAKFHKVFPAKFSTLIFLFTYFPFHIFGLYVTGEQLGALAAPLATALTIMLFFSYIPFFHMTAQGLINLSEYVERQELAGNRRAKFYVLAAIAGVVLLVGWLMFKPSPPPTPNVLSLQDHWALLETGGQDWQSDAYLNAVYFDVVGIGNDKISAIYLSNSKPDERYTVDIDENGKIFRKETSKNHPMRENAKLPIKREDWDIGSVQAWDLFLKNQNVNTCLTSDDKHLPLHIHLGRILSGKLAWELAVSNCLGEDHTASYYLDAKTGETIESYMK